MSFLFTHKAAEYRGLFQHANVRLPQWMMEPLNEGAWAPKSSQERLPIKHSLNYEKGKSIYYIKHLRFEGGLLEQLVLLNLIIY